MTASVTQQHSFRPGWLSRFGPIYETYLVCALFAALLVAVTVDETRLVRNFYYLAVLVPALPLLFKQLVAVLAGSRIALIAALLAGWQLVSYAWHPAFDLLTFADYGRRTLMVVLFLVLVADLGARCRTTMRLGFAWFLIPLVGVAGVLLANHIVNGISERLTGFGIDDNPVYTASIYAQFLLIALASGPFLSTPDGGLPWRSAGLGVATVVILVLVAATNSRGALLAFGAAATAGLLAAGRARVLVAIGLVLVACLGLFYAVSDGLLSPLSRGASYRPELWAQAIEVGLRQPWLGYGYSQAPTFVAADGTNFDETHNLALAVWLYSGLPALALIAALWVACAVVAAKALARGLGPLALVLVVFSALSYQFRDDDLLQNLSVGWILFWFPVALIAGEELSLRERRSGDALSSSIRSR